MITSADLCGEIAAESVRRVQAGGKLLVVRLHPVTFCRLIKDLGARATAGHKPGVIEAALTTPGGTVVVRSDFDASIEGHLYFDPAAQG